jgi:hypothetical protein
MGGFLLIHSFVQVAFRHFLLINNGMLEALLLCNDLVSMLAVLVSSRSALSLPGPLMPLPNAMSYHAFLVPLAQPIPTPS